MIGNNNLLIKKKNAIPYIPFVNIPLNETRGSYQLDQTNIDIPSSNYKQILRMTHVNIDIGNYDQILNMTHVNIDINNFKINQIIPKV